MNLEALKTGGAIRKQLEAVGGSIFHEDWRAGQRAKGITTWIRPDGTVFHHGPSTNRAATTAPSSDDSPGPSHR